MLELIIYLVIGVALIALLFYLFNREGRREEQARPQYAWEKAVEEYGDPTIISLYRRAKTDEERLEIASFVNPELANTVAQAEEQAEEIIEEESGKKQRRFGRRKAKASSEELSPVISEENDQPETTTTIDPWADATSCNDMTMVWDAEMLQQAQQKKAADSEAVDNDNNEILSAEADHIAEEESSEDNAVPASDDNNSKDAAETNSEVNEDDNQLIDNDLSIKEIFTAPAYNFWQEEALDPAATDSKKDQPTADAESEPAAAEPELAAAEPEPAAVEPEPAAVVQQKENFCPECGSPLEEGCVFCTICGTRIADVPAANEPEPTTASASSEPAAEPEISEQQPAVAAPAYSEPAPAVAETEPQQAKLCPVCGSPLEEGCAFCVICGTKIGDAPVDVPAATASTPADAASANEEAEPAAAAKSKRRIFGRRKAAKNKHVAATAETVATATAAAATAAAQPDIFAKEAAPAPVKEVRTCPECGAEIEDGFSFCIICGAEVAHKEQPEKDTPAADNTQHSFWDNKSQTQEPLSKQPAATAQSATFTEPQVVHKNSEDAVAAYRATTAHAYAAAANRKNFDNSDFIAAEHHPAAADTAQQDTAAAADAAQPTTQATTDSDSNKAANATTIDYSALTLQDILENVKALERRIMAEAEAAQNHSNERKVD